jgi:hypothetical protein
MEYINLWELIRSVRLNGMQKDSIVWKWTTDGTLFNSIGVQSAVPGIVRSVPNKKALESQC